MGVNCGITVLVLLEGSLDEDEVCEDKVAQEEVGTVVGRGAEAEERRHGEVGDRGSEQRDGTVGMCPND